jgi:hypothetical protein
MSVIFESMAISLIVLFVVEGVLYLKTARESAPREARAELTALRLLTWPRFWAAMVADRWRTLLTVFALCVLIVSTMQYFATRRSDLPPTLLGDIMLHVVRPVGLTLFVLGGVAFLRDLVNGEGNIEVDLGIWGAGLGLVLIPVLVAWMI